MPVHSIAHLIAHTLCECDGKDWNEIPTAERQRYCRISLLAEDRIRNFLLDGEDGPEWAEALIFGDRSRRSKRLLS